VSNINDDVAVPNNGITSMPNCVKIGQMVQELKWVDAIADARR